MVVRVMRYTQLQHASGMVGSRGDANGAKERLKISQMRSDYMGKTLWQRPGRFKCEICAIDKQKIISFTYPFIIRYKHGLCVENIP